MTLILLNAPQIWAQILINNIKWQIKSPKSRVYAAVKTLEVNPKNCKSLNTKILIFLENDSKQDARGIVLRYALRFRIKRFASEAGPAIWALPFHLEEVRVSRVKANSSHVVKLQNVNIATELRKLKNNGFWADAIGIEVMVEPKLGDDLERNIYQSLVKIGIKKNR